MQIDNPLGSPFVTTGSKPNEPKQVLSTQCLNSLSASDCVLNGHLGLPLTADLGSQPWAAILSARPERELGLPELRDPWLRRHGLTAEPDTSSLSLRKACVHVWDWTGAVWLCGGRRRNRILGLGVTRAVLHCSW